MSSMEANTEMALPGTLGIIPLKGRILLPSSALKLVMSSPRAVALVEDVLSASGGGGASSTPRS